MKIVDGVNATLTTDFRTAYAIRKIGLPIIICLGSVGNILSIVVFRQKSMRLSTSCYQLRMLAFADLFVLYASVLPRFVCYSLDTDIHEISDVTCKTANFLTYASVPASAWILTTVATERVVSIWRPLKAKSICTLRNGKLLVFFIVLASIGLNSVVPISLTLTATGCRPKASWTQFWVYFNVIDMAACSGVPVALLSICNVLIAFKLVRSENYRQKSLYAAHAKSIHVINNVKTSVNRSVGVMLVATSIVFLVLTSPIVVLNIVASGWKYSADVRYKGHVTLLYSVFELLTYSNNAINFFLYCITGARFRLELKRYLASRCRCCHNRGSLSPAATSTYLAGQCPATDGFRCDRDIVAVSTIAVSYHIDHTSF
ncbi:putative G-protein coupled receptor 139 [Tubulanus polymorphus]|uniref:putative G-protein coupled receptor 139 n=1 Tax=Tubulanus polymorphus TaxID=672921 RepID=UPI003DA37798